MKLTNDKLVVHKAVRKKESKKESFDFNYISFATDLGFSISIPIVGGAILGKYIDGKLSTYPTLTLSFIFLGLIIGIINIYRSVKNLK